MRFALLNEPKTESKINKNLIFDWDINFATAEGVYKKIFDFLKSM